MRILEYIYALIAIQFVGIAAILTSPIAAYIFVRENKKLKKATKLKEKLNATEEV